ncbi:MAG TPA: DUF499 domain-containing protein [Methylomirabilota bacterium]|nr:DUF499 domain-containing protein [Methylomirabilota bacterium]
MKQHRHPGVHCRHTQPTRPLPSFRYLLCPIPSVPGIPRSFYTKGTKVTKDPAKRPEPVFDSLRSFSECLQGREKLRQHFHGALGIWGALAEQLGKKERFKDYYSPLQAPGQSAWVNLLKGGPLVILLDELPPYFENARSKTIGNSDLARVTTTALSNLLTAVNKKELPNVCVVISDLKATYEGASQQISKALNELEAEVGRGALPLEPVALNTDELYHILRTRLFEELPSEEEIKLDPDKVTLVITEPAGGGGLDSDLGKFWQDATFRNRVAFLTGERETMDRLLETSAGLKAITGIIQELESPNITPGMSPPNGAN